MEKRMKSKKAQTMEMPFQFIFALFLIIVFVVAAGIAVNALLTSQQHAKIAAFYNDFQGEINNAFLATSMEKTLNLELPSKVEMICFSSSIKNANTGSLSNEEKLAYNNLNVYASEDANFFFYPRESVSRFKINPYQKIMCGDDKKTECLDLSNLPNKFYCVKNDNGIVKITIEKKYGQNEGVRIKI